MRFGHWSIWLAIVLGGTSQAAPTFEDSIAQRTLACTSCHGAMGRAGPDGYYPRIAGKPAGYLYNQLVNLRDGRRNYPLMTGLLAPLSDAYLMEMAQYFAKLDLPYAAPLASPAGSEVLQRGKTLALQGDGASKLPACVSCHGTALTGVAPNVPGLLGLPRDYLIAQLGGWRTGQRRAHAPDCMADVSKRLGPEDITAVTSWLAAQAVPANAKPASSAPPAVASDVKLICGSATGSAPVAASAPSGSSKPLPDPASPVARGAYLARAGNCMACHTNGDGAPYAGGRRIDTPFGGVFSSNLTPDRATGIGAWSAGDFWNALHHGRAKDGRLLYPVFPYTSYTQVSRADADALYAYLMSLPAVARSNTPHTLRWPYNTQAALAAWRAVYFSAADFKPVAGQSAEWNRGAYLVQGLGHCSACHAERNVLGASRPFDLGGGLIPLQNWYAPSLTTSHEAGVSTWDIADIVALFKTGSSRRGTVIGPMADVVLGSTQYLSDEDLTAVAVFLKALPQNPATATPATSPALRPATTATVSGPARPGAKLYERHCAQCHGEQGQGVPGAYAPLDGNRAVNLASSANLAQIVMFGGFAPATAGNPRPFGMPPFLLAMDDSSIATLLTHVRSAWGNHAPTVTELEVSQIRARNLP